MRKSLRWWGGLLALMVSYVTYGQCTAVSTYPYTEDFDGPTWSGTTTFDPCWTRVSTADPDWTLDPNTTPSSSTGPSADVTGGNYLFLETSGGSAGAEGHVNTPYFNMTSLTNPKLQFFYHKYGATMGDLIVQASLDSGATWCEVYRIVGQTHFASTDPWTLDSVDLSLVKSSATMLRFTGTRGTSFTGDMAIDSIAVYDGAASTGCSAPICLSLNAVTATTADLDWLSGGTAFDVEYGPTGFTPGIGSGTTANFAATSASLTGLSPATTYDAYVRNNCGGGTVSSWTGPVTFFTPCVIVNTFPYVETFDSTTSWTPNFTIDGCWTASPAPAFTWSWWVGSGFTGSGGTGPSSDVSGSGQYLFTEASYSSTALTYMQTPDFDLTSLTSPELKFMYHMFGSGMGNLYVQVSVDTGATWVTLDTLAGQQQSSETDAWQPRIVDLTGYATALTKIRFAGQRGSSLASDMAIDEVTVRNTPPCPDPANYAAFNITSTTAQVSFTAATGSTRIVEWGPTGFTPGTGLTGTSTTDTVSLSGLPAGTCIDLYLQADCSGAGNGTSTVSGPYTICTAYIPDWLEDYDAGYPPGDFSEAIGTLGSVLSYGNSNWIQDNYANVVGSSICAKFNIYSTFQPHHWMVSPAIDMGTGNTYNLEYDVSWTEWSQTASAVVGVDDTVHVVISTDGGATFPRSNIVTSYHTGNIVDATGLHEVFQLSGYNGIIKIGFYTTSTISNEDTDFFIDNLEVRTPPACQEPFGFNAISTFPDSIYYGFMADSSAVGYVVEWGPCGYTPGTGMTDTIYNDTAGLNGLSAASCYDMYIMTLCGSSTSIWGGPFSFTTACDTLPLPWTEDFDNATVPAMPTCWDLETSNTFYLQTASGTSGTNPGPRSGSNYLRHRYSFNNSWWSFTPEFSLQAGQSYEISFWYQTEGTTAFDEVTLAFGPGQTSADMIYNITTQTGVSSTTYTQFVATFIPPTTGIYHIGLKTRTSGFSGAMNIDDFNLQFDPNPCPNVSSLIANIVDENEVNLAWGGTSAHNTYDVEWGPSGFQVGTGQGRLVTGLTSIGLNIDTLSENTCYDFYVRADCGSGAGAWVGPYQWCTPCSASPLPYLEDFSGSWPCVTPNLGTQPWVPYNGWAEASYWSYNDIDFIMQMRNVDVTVDARVKFDWSHQHQTFYPEDRLTLLARVLGTSTWDTIWHLGGAAFESNDGAGSTVPGSGVGAIVALDPNTYTGNVVEFRFLGHSDFGPDAFVDNFLVEALPSCPEPYSVNSILASLTSSSGAVYFAPGGASNFNIAYGPAATTSTPSQGTVINATNDTVVITGLTPATLYNVWVRDSCGVGDVSFWTGPTQFQTLCVPFSTPYLETFSAWEPLCWDVDAGTSPWVQDGGWAEAQFWSFNNVDFIMNSPQIILSDTSELSFKWSKQYNSNYPDNGFVRVRNVNSMAWDTLWSRIGSAFESNDGAGPTTKGSGVSEYIRIDGYGAGDTIVIQFFGESSWGPNWFIDDFYVYDAPACAGPSNLGSTNETSSSADLYWTPGSAGSSTWIVEYGPSGFTPGNGTSVTVTNDTTTLTGLTPASAYCYFVTEICPNGQDSSSAIGPFCFATLCPPSFVAPYFTDLEVLPAGKITSGTWENCWGISNGVTIPRWESEDASGFNENSVGTGPLLDHSLNGATGGIYMYLETSGGALGDTASARLPWVDVSTLTVPEFAFWYHMYGATMGNLWIEGRDANNTNWVTLDSIMGQQQTSGADAWLEKTIILNQFTSDTVQIRFVGERGSSFTSDMSIDDVEIREAPTCPKINSVSFSNQTTSGADANWTATVAGQTYQIEYGGPGFTQGSGTMVPVTGTSYSFTGLPQNLVSEMYIRPICGAGDTGQWTGPFIIDILPVPCDDFEAYNLGLADAQSVFIEGWNGAGGDAEIVSYSGTQAMRIYTSGPSGYSDVVALMDTMTSGTHIVGFDYQAATGAGGYYNILHNYTGPSNVWAIEVYMDVNGTATVNQGTNGTGVIGTYSFNTTGWNRIEHVIDLDNDTAYIIVNGNVTTVGWQFSLGSANQADRFNAVNFYSAANAGQTPDYYVDNFCLCSVPGGIQALNTTCTTTDLDWNSQSGMGIVEYGAAGFTQGSGTITMATAPYTITGLTAGQSYDFYVGEECNGDTLYNGPISITMPNGPLPTLNITHFQDFVDLDSANYSFQANAVGADSIYWDFGGGATASGDSAKHTYTANGPVVISVTAFNDCGDTTYTYNLNVENISIAESTLGRTLSIYPNPSTGVITLDFTLDRNEETELYILNGLGQRVLKSDLGTINSFNGQFDLSHLPRGVYILQVNTGSYMVNRRVTLH